MFKTKKPTSLKWSNIGRQNYECQGHHDHHRHAHHGSSIITRTNNHQSPHCSFLRHPDLYTGSYSTGPRARAREPEPGPELHYVHPLQLMGECQVSVIYGTFWTRLLQANHTQVHDSYCSMSCMYVLTLAMLVEGSHRILDSRNMVLITGKAFTILGLVVNGRI